MRCVFVGTVEFSKAMLAVLLQAEADVALVIVRKNQAAHSDFADLKPLCRQHQVPLWETDDINSVDTVEKIQQVAPDVGFCFGWSQLISPQVLSVPVRGFIGYHPAMLPMNRGRHPLIWALVLGLKETGSSFFFMGERADSGPLVSQKKVSIDGTDDARSLYDKLRDTACQQIGEFLPLLEDPVFQGEKQQHEQATYWRKRSAADGQIDWRMSASTIYHLVRALMKPYVGAHFLFQNREIKVWKVEVVPVTGMEHYEFGKVISVNGQGDVLVKVSDGAIRLLEYDGPSLDVKAGDYFL